MSFRVFLTVLSLPPPGCGLPLLPGGQHVHVPGARVCAQHRRPAVPGPRAHGVPGAAAEGAPPAEHAQPALLRAGPHGSFQTGHPGAAHQPSEG